MAVERKILFNIATLKDISVMKLADENEISQANLSRWFKNQKGGYVREEKIERMASYLGVDYKTGRLLPGLHRWRGGWRQGELFIETLNLISPEGGMVVPISGAYEVWVAVPHDHSFRIILSISQLISGLFDNDPFNIESPWKRQDLVYLKNDQRGIVDRLKGESLTIPDLDAIIGINDSSWTWERLVAVLKDQGKVPEEVAQELGLTERENKSKRETPSRKKMPLLSRSTEGESIAAEDEPQ